MTLPFKIHPEAQDALELDDNGMACLLKRFAKYLSVPDNKPDTCWTWGGNRQIQGGYGIVSFKGRRERTNRVAFVLANGRWPEHFACHRCDCAPCSRPSHLYDGTPADNARDACERGRFRTKLTVDQVRRIKFDASNLKSASTIKLARQYDVDPSNIRQIHAGKIWRHVEP